MSAIKGGALWTGNSQLATTKQLTSTSQGLYNDLQDLSGFSFQHIDVSTITVRDWISAPTMYVSTIYGGNIDISGMMFDASGVLYAPQISASQGIFNITNISVMQMTFKPTFTGNIEVSFNLGLGEAIGGIAAGLGAAVGGAFIGVGTGVGLAIQGAEQGIATMIAGRPQNFINENHYETINFTSQLQISTLGNDYAVYSTIFRTVSSVSADTIPGKEIFTSTLFYPGQICIRSASDPINLITGNSNLNTSTIQSFGQWVPLTGLEPENIVADSISTNFLSTGNLYASLGFVETLESFSGQFSNVGITTSQSMNFNAPLNFNLGGSGNADIKGFINQWNFQTDQPIVFSQLGDPGSLTPGAILTLGTGAESIFQVSSINSTGEIKTVNFYASTITAEQLNVVSTLFLTSTNIEIITSTQTLTADNAFILEATISSLSTISFGTGVGNPVGAYDINKKISYFSTLFNSVSSFTNNILNYQLNLSMNDEASFNMGGQGAGTPPARYTLSPLNVQQWASTMIISNPNNGNPSALNITIPQTFISSALTHATFDLTVDQTRNGFYFNANQLSTPQGLASSLIQITPNLGSVQTYRFTINPTGWWDYVSPAPPMYQTTNCNVLTISQDINDVNITTTDRLNITAGDIFLTGQTHLENLNITNLNVESVTTVSLETSTISAYSAAFGNIEASNMRAIGLNSQTGYSGSMNDVPTLTPLLLGYSSITSTDFTNNYDMTIPSRSPNYFNSLNVSQWNNSIFNAVYASAADVPRVMVADLFQVNPMPTYAGQFYINNNINFPPRAVPIYQNIEGYASTIGTVAGSTYARIRTLDGSTWAIDSNIANPQGGTFGPYTYQSEVNTTVKEDQVVSLTQQPTVVVAPTYQITTNKILLQAPIIRTLTYGSSNWTTREAGIEFSSYYDADVVFTGTQSDALNPILNPLGNLYYAYSAWSAQVWIGRLRTESLGIQGFEVIGTPTLYAGTSEYIWSSARYLNVNASPPEANIREMYLMIPANYMTITSFTSAW